MSFSLSHWYHGSGVYLIVLLPNRCTLTYLFKACVYLMVEYCLKYNNTFVYLFSSWNLLTYIIKVLGVIDVNKPL